jgi:Zn-dependent peptidase ImmA (M78 family)
VPVRVDVNPELLVWARERAGLEPDVLERRFPRLEEWERGALAPTLKQLEDYAKATHAPIGFLFLPEPPDEHIPIPDYRTIRNEGVARPSADLLDTIFQCQLRQDWYRELAEGEGDRVAFVGSLSRQTPIVDAAATMRGALGFDVEERGASWTEALRSLIDRAEGVGVLVMVNGVVGSNTHRRLDPEEFRGFALVDPFAPVVFVNGADTKAAQIFTLAHELAHMWLGESALSDASILSAPDLAIERWCNQVAAEFLVPLAAIAQEFDRDNEDLTWELQRLARRFKVSTLVVLRRAHDAGRIDRHEYPLLYERELERLRDLLEDRPANPGGNFFNTQPLRVSTRFARALLMSTLEGETLRRDAVQLLGFKKLSTLDELAQRLGVA